MVRPRERCDRMPSFMKRVFLPRHFLASGLLLLILASLYVFFEAQRLQQELLRQTEDKGTALAKAMETSVKNAIVGNALLEDLIRQRLVDNARLIDQFGWRDTLLIFGGVLLLVLPLALPAFFIWGLSMGNLPPLLQTRMNLEMAVTEALARIEATMITIHT